MLSWHRRPSWESALLKLLWVLLPAIVFSVLLAEDIARITLDQSHVDVAQAVDLSDPEEPAR